MRGRSRACGFPWQQGLEKPPIGKRMLMEGKTQVYIEKAASEKVPGITKMKFPKQFQSKSQDESLSTLEALDAKNLIAVPMSFEILLI